jgi:tetratricopeptide (TPR) repeat protein
MPSEAPKPTMFEDEHRIVYPDSLKYIREHPRSPLAKAEQLFAAGDTAACDTLLREFLVANFEGNEVQRKEASIAAIELARLASQRDLQEAIEICELAVELDMEQPEPWNLLARLYLKAGEYERADAAALKVGMLGKAADDAYVMAAGKANQAIALRHLGYLDHAREYHLQALELYYAYEAFPDVAREAVTLAYVHLQLENYDEAEAALRKGLEFYTHMEDHDGVENTKALLADLERRRGRD